LGLPLDLRISILRLACKVKYHARPVSRFSWRHVGVKASIAYDLVSKKTSAVLDHSSAGTDSVRFEPWSIEIRFDSWERSDLDGRETAPIERRQSWQLAAA